MPDISGDWTKAHFDSSGRDVPAVSRSHMAGVIEQGEARPGTDAGESWSPLYARCQHRLGRVPSAFCKTKDCASHHYFRRASVLAGKITAASFYAGPLCAGLGEQLRCYSTPRTAGSLTFGRNSIRGARECGLTAHAAGPSHLGYAAHAGCGSNRASSCGR